MRYITFLATVALSSLAYGQKLTKPVLEQSLDYLQAGLMANLGSCPSTVHQWVGWIPSDCVKITQDNNLDPDHVLTYNVTYDDCDTPWILCRHRDSPSPVENMIDLFGRVPVHMRQWVRHMIALPSPTGGHAYNEHGNIAMFDKIDGDLTVFIHETGHSLDLLGAYPEKPLSSSNYWLTQYALDTNTCDPYAQTNQIENVAQNTVVGTFNEVVPGGYCSVEPNCAGNFHQYATLQTEADRARPGEILHAGGRCTRRLANSKPVRQPSASSRIMRRGDDEPDVSLSGSVKVIEPVDFNTKEHCKHTW